MKIAIATNYIHCKFFNQALYLVFNFPKILNKPIPLPWEASLLSDQYP